MVFVRTGNLSRGSKFYIRTFKGISVLYFAPYLRSSLTIIITSGADFVKLHYGTANFFTRFRLVDSISFFDAENDAVDRFFLARQTFELFAFEVAEIVFCGHK